MITSLRKEDTDGHMRLSIMLSYYMSSCWNREVLKPGNGIIFFIYCSVTFLFWEFTFLYLIEEVPGSYRRHRETDFLYFKVVFITSCYRLGLRLLIVSAESYGWRIYFYFILIHILCLYNCNYCISFSIRVFVYWIILILLPVPRKITNGLQRNVPVYGFPPGVFAFALPFITRYKLYDIPY